VTLTYDDNRGRLRRMAALIEQARTIPDDAPLRGAFEVVPLPERATEKPMAAGDN
jgi:hypothetical protein